MSLAHLEKWATWSEILAQPAIWRQWGKTFDPVAVADWISGLNVDEIWLTGAGTSAYIGDIIAAGLEGRYGPGLRAVPSTDIVSRPAAFLKDRAPLVVSFGRSGDSTESIGVLDALDRFAPTAPQLNITCNSASALANRPSSGAQKVITLPAETHDTGFAMTSSFSTMLLTALAVLDPVEDFAGRLDTLASGLETLIGGFEPQLAPPPERIVFVGAGPLTFAARESALKVMELSAGQMPALWDSTLGFRHGPKSFVTDATMICLLASPDAHARKYDDDLAAELRGQFPTARIVTIGPGADVDIPMPLGATWSAPLAVAHAQLLSVYWSDRLGLNVDDPFAGKGTLTRVVSGVKLHEPTQ